MFVNILHLLNIFILNSYYFTSSDIFSLFRQLDIKNSTCFCYSKYLKLVFTFKKVIYNLYFKVQQLYYIFCNIIY